MKPTQTINETLAKINFFLFILTDQTELCVIRMRHKEWHNGSDTGVIETGLCANNTIVSKIHTICWTIEW